MEKKEKKAQKVPFGNPSFDKLIDGGFPQNSINLVVGGVGSGKTIFSTEFLINGIKKGEKVLFISFEEKKQSFLQNMKKFKWDLAKKEKENKFIFLEYAPEKMKMMIDEGGGSIESIVVKEKIKRIVIDSISSFLLLFDDPLEKRDAALSLFDMIKRWQCTSLMTVQLDTSSKEKIKSMDIGFEADGVILLYLTTIKSTQKRFIEILKMRGTKHSKEIHSFEITENGIKIGKKSKIQLSQKAKKN